MKSVRPIEKPVKVGTLIRQRLKELGKSSEELAEFVEVPKTYIDDLISGRRRPPRPARTDLYERMTPYLRLSRNDLSVCAIAEHDAAGRAIAPPKPAVRRLLLDLCEPETARRLGSGSGKRATAQASEYYQRLLDRTQAVVRRVLADPMALRLAAQRSSATYAAMRLQVLEFLDATPDTLTANDLNRFIRPWVAAWDVDFETGVLRVVMHGYEPKGSHPPTVFRRGDPNGKPESKGVAAMAKSGFSHHGKRTREIAKRKKQMEKAERRAKRKEEKAQATQNEDGAGDPDLEGIVPGPQPPLR